MDQESFYIKSYKEQNKLGKKLDLILLELKKLNQKSEKQTKIQENIFKTKKGKKNNRKKV